MKLLRMTSMLLSATFLLAGLASCGSGSGKKSERELRNQGRIDNYDGFVKRIFPGNEDLLPTAFDNPSWESIESIYGYLYLKTPVKGSDVRTMMVLGSYTENKLVGALDVNPYMIVGRQGSGKYNNRFVIPFEQYPENSKQPFNDMTAFNDLIRQVPELKNFSWKNDLQNRVYSSLIMYTQLRGMSTTATNLHLESPEETHNGLIQKIYAGGKYSFNSRNFLRYNSNVDLTKEITRSGFLINDIENTAKETTRLPKDLFNPGEFDFNDRSHLFIYYPFISYNVRPESDGRLDYWPAVAILDFKITMSADSFPQVTRKTYFVSLFDKKVRRTE